MSDLHTPRTKPRIHETVSVGGRTKWRLDALCLAGRRSRTATIDVLIDFYCKHNPSVRDFIEERQNDPKPVQVHTKKIPSTDVSTDQGEKGLTP
jgi:hypothetical protein